MDNEKKAKFEGRDSLKVRTRGELIAAIRKRLGYSQEDLEWKSGVSKTQISRIERDLVNPGIGTIKRLEKALDVPLMDLFINPDEVNQENLLEVKQPGTLLTQFEKKLARKKISTKELQLILNKALVEIEKRKDKDAGNNVGEDKKEPKASSRDTLEEDDLQN